MALTTSDYEKGLLAFSDKSLRWCAKESEVSTVQISQAIDQLIQNTARVSELSEESLEAIASLQKEVRLRTLEKSGKTLDSLIKTLEDLAHENEEVQAVINPIIQSLQFQDRLRQNFENISQMIEAWLKMRAHCPEAGDFTEDEVMRLGQKLAECTTMKSERDIIRKHFKGLEDEKEAAPVTMF